MNNVNMYPVLKTYQVFLACSTCGTDMTKDDPGYFFDSRIDRGTFCYVCPKCNNRMTSETQYPFQRVTYDLTAKVVTTEAEVQ